MMTAQYIQGKKSAYLWSRPCHQSRSRIATRGMSAAAEPKKKGYWISQVVAIHDQEIIRKLTERPLPSPTCRAGEAVVRCRLYAWPSLSFACCSGTPITNLQSIGKPIGSVWEGFQWDARNGQHSTQGVTVVGYPRR